MKHPFNQQLFSYWMEKRGERDAPERGDIEPGAIRGMLGDSFILAYEAEMGASFRVAGTRLCALFGREQRGQLFETLWDAESAPQIRNLVAIVAEEGIGIAAGATARAAEDSQCNFELLLLPLSHRGTMGVRMLGILAPLMRPYWLGIWPAQTLRLGVFQFVGQPSVDSLAIGIESPRAGIGGRRALTVIEGGRS
jgi:hypothetical protein